MAICRPSPCIAGRGFPRFYEEARGCYAIVQVLERRPYGNVVLTKGVVGPDGKDLMP